MISVAGIQAKTESLSSDALSSDALSSDALSAVRSLAEAAARQRGVSLIDSGLRLFDEPVDESPGQPDTGPDSEPISPFALGRTYELLLAPSARRKTGSHLTPEGVARNLVAFLPASPPRCRVLDPAVGGAAFLLAAADSLVDAGAKPTEVSDKLFGLDIDPGAVAVAEAAISLWGLDRDVAPRPLAGVQTGDGLLDELPVVDRVVGNPPFLNQLRSSSTHTTDRRSLLRERWGDLVTAYTDDAWLFLAAGLDALEADGSMVMVQPISILAARHGDEVRRYVGEHATLDGLWVGRDQVFDAAVQVCGLVIRRATGKNRPVMRSVGAAFTRTDPLAAQPAADEWGSAGAETIGVPSIRISSTHTVGDLADATAGFRDQFYGFVPYVSELDSDASAQDLPNNVCPLVTVGMIDVLQLLWGSKSFKFAKQDYERPVIDVAALNRGDNRLGEWVQARSRPKLLMATQTRVVEVWVDEHGHAIPATPVLSIEPHGTDVDSLWMLAAALTAPAISAHFQATKFGTAMSLNAMKIAARDVVAAPLPTDETAWAAATDLIRKDPAALEEFAVLMQQAYGVTHPTLHTWWLGRVPNRSA